MRLSYTDVDEGEDGNASYTAFLTCLPPSHVVQLYFDAGADTGAGASITEADSLLNATENAACDCNSDGDGINDDDDEYTSVCVQIPLNKSMTLYAKVIQLTHMYSSVSTYIVHASIYIMHTYTCNYIKCKNECIRFFIHPYKNARRLPKI